MYITTVYSNLSSKQKNKVKNFLANNFEQNSDFDLNPMTIIVLDLEENNINGCLCLYDNSLLTKKLNKRNVPTEYYHFEDNSHGCFIYNFCVDKEKRGKKIGTNLLKYTISKMKELNIDYLHAHAENKISEMVFIKSGFFEQKNFNFASLMLKYV